MEAAEQFPENEPGRIACKRAGGETISAEYGRQENDECTAPEHMARRPFRRIKLRQPIAGKKEQAEQRSREEKREQNPFFHGITHLQIMPAKRGRPQWCPTHPQGGRQGKALGRICCFQWR